MEPMTSAALISGGASLLGNAFGSNSADRRTKRQHRYNKELVQLGNQWDIANQKEMFDYRIDQGIEAGMTPYEMFMGPAAGAGGGTSGSGATLGNNATQMEAQAMQAEQQRISQSMEAAKDISIAQMNNETQKDVTQMQVDAQTRGQDIQADIADARLAFDKQHYKQVILPKLAADLALNEQQVQKAINEVVTSSPKFQRAMKQLTMGVDNLYVETLLKEAGISPTSSQEDWNKIPENKRAALLAALDKARSSVAREGQGLAEVLKDLVNWLVPQEEQSMEEPPVKLGNRGRITIKAPGGVSNPFQHNPPRY
jgi:hypothetical protein